MSEKTYYVLNDLEGYGSEYPVCVDEAEKNRLNGYNEWNTTDDDWHEASRSEIEEYGVYDSREV